MSKSSLAEKLPIDPALIPYTIPSIGSHYGGGRVGDVTPRADGSARVLIFASAAEGYIKLSWAKRKAWDIEVPGALSLSDSTANTAALNDKDHPAALHCSGMRIAGLDDWRLPSIVDLAKGWTNLGPDHTDVDDFKAGGSEAFHGEAHWSSTQSKFGEDYAWCLYFGTGYQDDGHESGEFWVRAVREVIIPAIPQFPDA